MPVAIDPAVAHPSLDRGKIPAEAELSALDTSSVEQQDQRNRARFTDVGSSEAFPRPGPPTGILPSSGLAPLQCAAGVRHTSVARTMS
jgi:hypothetical protein